VTLPRESSGKGPASLPNLIVIGAQKCGTSALHYYLGLHPQVQMSSPKELWFFTAAEDFRPEAFLADPGSAAERRLITGSPNWSRGVEWYASHFSAESPVRGESTPAYASPWFPGVARRMAEIAPDARLIFMARDPVERIVSQYMHARAQGREWRSLQQVLSTPRNPYLARSRYASVLRPFLERFPRERILLLRQEDLLHDRRETVREVFAFLGVDEGFWDPRIERLRQPSARKGRRFRAAERLRQSRLAAPAYRLPQEAKWAIERLASGSRDRVERPRMEPALRASLLEQLEPEIAALEELSGWDLDAWRRPAMSEASS